MLRLAIRHARAPGPCCAAVGGGAPGRAAGAPQGSDVAAAAARPAQARPPARELGADRAAAREQSAECSDPKGVEAGFAGAAPLSPPRRMATEGPTEADVHEAAHLLGAALSDRRAFSVVIGGGRLPLAVYNVALFDARMQEARGIRLVGESSWHVVWRGFMRSIERMATRDAPGCIAIAALVVECASVAATRAALAPQTMQSLRGALDRAAAGLEHMPASASWRRTGHAERQGISDLAAAARGIQSVFTAGAQKDSPATDEAAQCVAARRLQRPETRCDARLCAHRTQRRLLAAMRASGPPTSGRLTLVAAEALRCLAGLPPLTRADANAVISGGGRAAHAAPSTGTSASSRRRRTRRNRARLDSASAPPPAGEDGAPCPDGGRHIDAALVSPRAVMALKHVANGESSLTDLAIACSAGVEAEDVDAVAAAAAPPSDGRRSGGAGGAAGTGSGSGAGYAGLPSSSSSPSAAAAAAAATAVGAAAAFGSARGAAARDPFARLASLVVMRGAALAAAGAEADAVEAACAAQREPDSPVHLAALETCLACAGELTTAAGEAVAAVRAAPPALVLTAALVREAAALAGGPRAELREGGPPLSPRTRLLQRVWSSTVRPWVHRSAVAAAAAAAGAGVTGPAAEAEAAVSGFADDEPPLPLVAPGTSAEACEALALALGRGLQPADLPPLLTRLPLAPSPLVRALVRSAQADLEASERLAAAEASPAAAIAALQALAPDRPVPPAAAAATAAAATAAAAADAGSLAPAFDPRAEWIARLRTGWLCLLRWSIDAAIAPLFRRAPVLPEARGRAPHDAAAPADMTVARSVAELSRAVAGHALSAPPPPAAARAAVEAHRAVLEGWGRFETRRGDVDSLADAEDSAAGFERVARSAGPPHLWAISRRGAGGSVSSNAASLGILRDLSYGLRRPFAPEPSSAAEAEEAAAAAAARRGTLDGDPWAGLATPLPEPLPYPAEEALAEASEAPVAAPPAASSPSSFCRPADAAVASLLRGARRSMDR